MDSRTVITWGGGIIVMMFFGLQLWTLSELDDLQKQLAQIRIEVQAARQ